jgi:hypothetical protein
VTYTEYPTDRDRQADTNGTKRSGQVVSAAPTPGGKWVIREDTRQFALVIARGDRPAYSIANPAWAAVKVGA